MLKDTSFNVLRLAGINAGVAVSDPVQTGSLILAAKGELRQKPRSPETKSALRGGLIGLATYRPTQTREGRNYAGKEVVASSLLVTQALVAKMIREKSLPVTWEEIGRITKLSANVLTETYPRGGVAESVSNALFDLPDEKRKEVVLPLVATLATQQDNGYDITCARMLVVGYVLHRASANQDMYDVLVGNLSNEAGSYDPFGDLIEVALA
jgi:hypothetical protein